MRTVSTNVLLLFFIIAPGSLMAKMQIRFYYELQCETGSAIEKFSANTTMPAGMDCNGYQKGDYPYKYQAVINGNGAELEITRNQIQTLTVNGNMIATLMGEITGGECSGDHFLLILVSIADHQKACKSSDGLNSLSVSYGYAIVDGKCRSRCGKATGSWVYEEGVKGVPNKN